jgi:hypothetical protein
MGMIHSKFSDSLNFLMPETRSTAHGLRAVDACFLKEARDWGCSTD